MAGIIRVAYISLKRDEQIAFNDDVLKTVLNTCGRCHETINVFERSVEHLAELMRQKAFQPSLSLYELDKIADQAWYAMHMQIKASLLHPQPEIREAAQSVSDIFLQTPNPTNLNYEKEYGALRTLLSQLETMPDGTLAQALVEPHYYALRLAVDNFIQGTQDKIDAASQIETGALKVAVAACYKAWQNMVRYLEMTSELEDNAQINDAINKINTLISSLKQRLSGRNL